MRFLGFGSRVATVGVLAAAALAVLAAVDGGRAFAIGEAITDIRILDNQRTEESTVRSIAGISIGDTLEADTLDKVRERLNTVGLFADVNVWWEPHGAGVRVNIAVKDKFPWAPVPTASWSANNKSIGLVFVHGNLFGRGKQLLLGGRLASVDSGLVLAYRDPALFGSWIYWQLQGSLQRQVVPEFDNYGADPLGMPIRLGNPFEIRETHWFSYGFEAVAGVAWMRRVKTQVAWRLEQYNFDESVDPRNPDVLLTPATRGGVNGIGRAQLMFDFRAREFAVMTGSFLSGSVDIGSPDFKSDFKWWRGSVAWEQGIKFFRAHNLIYSLFGTTGHNLPFWNENTAGGPNSRGYLFQQFRGDSALSAKFEYHFPLFSIGSLDFRALGFVDTIAIWFREVPDPLTNPVLTDPNGTTYVERATADRRTFPTNIESGFSFDKSIHNSVGAGLRFFLRSVAVPLVGFDAGYGIEARNWRFILIVGA